MLVPGFHNLITAFEYKLQKVCQPNCFLFETDNVTWYIVFQLECPYFYMVKKNALWGRKELQNWKFLLEVTQEEAMIYIFF